MHHGTPFLPPLAIAGKLLKSTQTSQPAQSSRINNIQHTIPFVNKPKLAYIYNQKNCVPKQRHVVTTKYSKCTFTALLMTPWTRKHKEDSKVYSYGNALLIYKSGWHGHGWHEPFCCHIICNQCSIPSQQGKWNSILDELQSLYTPHHKAQNQL